MSQKNKKRKHRGIEGKNTNNSIDSKKSQSPPKKKQKILKRSSKKPILSHATTPNSHITITFANINHTIDAIVLPKQNVLAMNSDVLLQNKGKLSIKTSDPLQNDITPQIPMDIKILTTPNIKTIHPRNSFRMGTSLFLCSDEERLFWSFPLRNTRRVSCQHYCCVVNKIVTRSVGIHSNKCNGKHSQDTPCIYAVCNGKPPKGIIPAKLFANYQYFQHSANTELLVSKDPNDEKFKKVPNTNSSSTMYQDIKVLKPPMLQNGPPPLTPIHSLTSKTLLRHNVKHNTKKTIKSESETLKRRRLVNNNGEPIPFQQNVQIDLKALAEKKQKLTANISTITSSSSIGSNQELHNYSELLLHSTSSVLRDANDLSQIPISISKRKQCKQLLLNAEFDKVISLLKEVIPLRDFPDSDSAKTKTKSKVKSEKNSQIRGENTKANEYRLLMATALYYRDYVGNGENDSSSALHFCNLIVSNCANDGNIQYYEARKIRGLIHKKLRNYKAACHDLEFISFNNPYHQTWRDRLYVMGGKSNFLENKIISPKHSNNVLIEHHRPPPIQHILLQQGRPNKYVQNIANMPRLNEIMTNNINYFPPNYDSQALNILAQNMVNTAINPPIPNMDITNPNAPIVFIPPIMDRNSNNNSGTNTPKHKNSHTKANKLGIDLSDFHMPKSTNPNRNTSANAKTLGSYTYSDLAQPQRFPQRSTSNTSFEGLIALAHAASTEYDKKQGSETENEIGNGAESEGKKVLNAQDLLEDLDGFTAMKRKTTREELLGEQCMNLESSNEANNGSVNEECLDIPNLPQPLHKTVSTTPEPLQRIRSDALVRNSSQ